MNKVVACVFRTAFYLFHNSFHDDFAHKAAGITWIWAFYYITARPNGHLIQEFVGESYDLCALFVYNDLTMIVIDYQSI